MDEWSQSMYSEAEEVVRRLASGDPVLGTLSISDVAQEVYLRFLESPEGEGVPREQLKAYVGQTVRRLLVDVARKKRAEKRSGSGERLQLAPHLLVEEDGRFFDALVVDELLGQLEALDARQARAVEMRWFGGADTPAIATSLGVSERTARNDLRFGQAWIKSRLEKGPLGAD